MNEYKPPHFVKGAFIPDIDSIENEILIICFSSLCSALFLFRIVNYIVGSDGESGP